MIDAKLKQLLIAFRAGVATLPYPFEPRPSEPGFRGKVVVDTDKCTGCGGCADVCPARCIKLIDVLPTLRIIRRYLDRCIHCGRCEDVCFYGALRLDTEYELATTDRRDLFIEQRLFMGSCNRCGRCYVPPTPIDRLMVVGFRQDEPLDGNNRR